MLFTLSNRLYDSSIYYESLVPFSYFVLELSYLSWNFHTNIYISNPSKYLYIRSSSSFHFSKSLNPNSSSFHFSKFLNPNLWLLDKSDPLYRLFEPRVYNLPSTTLSNIFKIKDSEESSFIFLI